MKSSGASASPKKRRGGRIVKAARVLQEAEADSQRAGSPDHVQRRFLPRPDDRRQGGGDGIRPAKDRRGAHGRTRRREPLRRQPLPGGEAAGERLRRRCRLAQAATERLTGKTDGRGNNRRRSGGPARGVSCQARNAVRRSRRNRDGGDGSTRSASVSRPSRGRGSRARCARAAPRSPGGSSPHGSAERQWHRSVAQTIPDRRPTKTTFNCKSNSHASVFGTQVDL